MLKSIYSLNNIINYLLIGNEGKIFTVTFRKKDGSVRVLNGRLGVHHGKKLQKPTTAGIPKYIVVYDMQKKAYRNVNTSTVTAIKMKGKEFIVA
jgi:hypothetical protein